MGMKKRHSMNHSTSEGSINADLPIIRNGRLVSIAPAEGAGGIWELNLDEVRLGRCSCDIRLEDESASRLHAVIQRDTSGFVLVDLNSTNGTYVNGQPIQRHHLVDGDHIQLGRHSLEFLSYDLVDTQFQPTVFNRAATTDELMQNQQQNTATGSTGGFRWLCRTLKRDLPPSTKAAQLRGRDAKRSGSRRSAGHRRFRLINVIELTSCLSVLTLLFLGSIEACNAIFLKPTLVEAGYEGALIRSEFRASEAEIVQSIQTFLSSCNIAGTVVTVDANGSSFDALRAGELFTVHVAATVAGNLHVPLPFPMLTLVESRVVGHRQD